MTVQYLIDSENVGDFWIPLLELPDEATELIVFYTKNSPHMSYESLIKLKESDKKVTFIKCYEGTNALDFQLVSELGYRICQNAEGRFVVVTNDTGYDAAVKYWRRRQRSVKRITGKECKNLDRRLREDIYGSDNVVRTPRAPRAVHLKEEGDGHQTRLSGLNLRDVEAAARSDQEDALPQEVNTPEEKFAFAPEESDDLYAEDSETAAFSEEEDASGTVSETESEAGSDTGSEAASGIGSEAESGIASETEHKEGSDFETESGSEAASSIPSGSGSGTAAEAASEAFLPVNGPEESAAQAEPDFEDRDREDGVSFFSGSRDAAPEHGESGDPAEASQETESFASEENGSDDAEEAQNPVSEKPASAGTMISEDTPFDTSMISEGTSFDGDALEGSAALEEKFEGSFSEAAGSGASILAADDPAAMEPESAATELESAVTDPESAATDAEAPEAAGLDNEAPEDAGSDTEASEDAGADAAGLDPEAPEDAGMDSAGQLVFSLEDMSFSVEKAAQTLVPDRTEPQTEPDAEGLSSAGDDADDSDPGSGPDSENMEKPSADGMEENADLRDPDSGISGEEILPFFPDELEEPGESAEGSRRSKSRRTRSRRGKSTTKKSETQEGPQKEETAGPAPKEEKKPASGSRRKTSGSEKGQKTKKEAAEAAGKDTGDKTPAQQETASAGRQPSEEEIARITACIGADNLVELHNQLATFYGDQGKDIYLSIRNGVRPLPDLHLDLKQKFAYYCEIIFSNSDAAEELPEDMAEYLLSIREKLENLNSLRYALIKHYGKEKGRRFYFLLKPYVKAMHQM